MFGIWDTYYREMVGTIGTNEMWMADIETADTARAILEDGRGYCTVYVAM